MSNLKSFLVSFALILTIFALPVFAQEKNTGEKSNQTTEAKTHCEEKAEGKSCCASKTSCSEKKVTKKTSKTSKSKSKKVAYNSSSCCVEDKSCCVIDKNCCDSKDSKKNIQNVSLKTSNVQNEDCCSTDGKCCLIDKNCCDGKASS